MKIISIIIMTSIIVHSAMGAESHLDASITPENKEYTNGSPIALRLSVENKGSDSTTILFNYPGFMARGEGGLDIKINGLEERLKINSAQENREIEGDEGRIPTIKIGPKDMFSVNIYLNRYLREVPNGIIKVSWAFTPTLSDGVLSKTITGDFSITVNKRKDGEIDDFTELVNGARSGSYWGKRSAIEGLISNNSAAVIPSLYELNGMSLQEYGIPALFKFIKSPGVNAAILEQLNSKRQQAVTTVLQEGSSVNDFAIPTDKITFLLNEKNEVISNAVWIYLKENKNESTRETLMMLKGSNEPSIVKNATTILESKVK